MDLDKRKFQIYKVVGGLVLGVIVGLFLIYNGWDTPTTILVFFLGGLIGWITGILFSPKDSNQHQAFGEYRAGIATFLGGITLAKAEQYLGEYLQSPKAKVEAGDWFEHVLYFLIGCGLGLLTTFVGRTADGIFDENAKRELEAAEPLPAADDSE